MQKQQAFTVTELLVSLAVVMILITITNQAYSHFLSQQSLITSGDRLYQFLRLAKVESIKANKKVYVHFCQKGISTEWRMALSEQASCDCFVKNSCLLNGLQQTAILSDGKFVSTSPEGITFTGLKVSYSPMRFSVNAGSVTLNDKSGQKLKVIQSTKRLRICSPESDTLGYKQC